MAEMQHKLLSPLMGLSCEEVGIICQRLEGKRNKSIDLIPQVLIPRPIPILTLVPVFRQTGAAQPLSPTSATETRIYLHFWVPTLCLGTSSSRMDSLCLSLIVSALPPHPQPPGSEASLGNSLNASEEELHTAGITLAPKGSTRTADLHPDSPDRYPLLL